MADHFGRTFTRADQTPQPHNHPSDPTLDELIAEWVERSRSCVPASEYHQKVVATAAALRELRELREGVARVRELHTRQSYIAQEGEYCLECFPNEQRYPCPTLRALTPEGTT